MSLEKHIELQNAHIARLRESHKESNSTHMENHKRVIEHMQRYQKDLLAAERRIIALENANLKLMVRLEHPWREALGRLLGRQNRLP